MTHPGIRPAPHFLGGHLSLLQSLAKVLLCAQEPSLDNSRSFSILKSGSCVVALHILGSICALLQGLSKVLVCAQEPSLDDSKNFSILQPGSSVATALSEGESKRKHVVLLEIMGEQWRTVKVALRTVRPFLFESVRPTACPIPSSSEGFLHCKSIRNMHFPPCHVRVGEAALLPVLPLPKLLLPVRVIAA